MATPTTATRTTGSSRALAGLLAVLLLGACSASGGGDDLTTKDGGSTTTTEAKTTTTERERTTTTTERRRTTTTERETTTTTKPPTKTGKFGDTYAFGDGLTVTIGNPFPFTPGPYSSADPAASYLGFDVQITNGSATDLDPSFYTTLQSGTTEADSVYDSDAGIGSGPSGALLAGRTSTFRIGYGVTDPNDLVLTVNVDYEHGDVIFTS